MAVISTSLFAGCGSGTYASAVWAQVARQAAAASSRISAFIFMLFPFFFVAWKSWKGIITHAAPSFQYEIL